MLRNDLAEVFYTNSIYSAASCIQSKMAGQFYLHISFHVITLRKREKDNGWERLSQHTMTHKDKSGFHRENIDIVVREIKVSLK